MKSTRKLNRKEEKIRKKREQKLRELIFKYVLDYADTSKEDLNGTKRDTCLSFCWSLLSLSHDDLIQYWKMKTKEEEKRRKTLRFLKTLI